MSLDSAPGIPIPDSNQHVQTISSGNQPASPFTLMLKPGDPSETVFISGFEITGGGATAASIISIAVTGLKTGGYNYALAIPAGANVGVQPLIIEFPYPMPAAAPGQAISLSVPSFGAGNTNAVANMHGHSQRI